MVKGPCRALRVALPCRLTGVTVLTAPETPAPRAERHAEHAEHAEHSETRDVRVASIRPLLPPAILLEELPLSDAAAETVSRGRDAVRAIIAGRDDRLLVVV